MIALFLAVWTACGGDCNWGKLEEKWSACCRSLQTPTPPKEMDWMEYYRYSRPIANPNNVYPNGRINYAPVFVSPVMQWAVPNSVMSGPPPAGGSYSDPKQ